MTREEEKKLIKRVLGGDTDAFEALVTENQKNVYNLALKMTGNPENAADVSQEAFLKAYTSLRSFRGDSSFSVWLYRLTSNACIDFLRRDKRLRSVPLTAGDEDGERELEIPDERYLPEAETERKETRELVERGLASLSPEHRQIVTLRDINGLSYTEIAQVLEVEEGTVKSRLARARLRLAKFLTAHGNFDEFSASKR